MGMIRKAAAADASRIAEILVFAKRTDYRRIFNNDAASFGEIQVYPLARGYIEDPEKLLNIWVYDDVFVKGMLHTNGAEIEELYVDPFFQGEGIGGTLLDFACESMGCSRLWVLEKNERAIRFYERHGFLMTGERAIEDGTPEYLVRMERQPV